MAFVAFITYGCLCGGYGMVWHWLHLYSVHACATCAYSRSILLLGIV